MTAVPLPHGIALAALECIRQAYEPGTMAHDTAHKALDDAEAARAGQEPHAADGLAKVLAADGRWHAMEPQPAPEMGTGSAPSDVRPRADGRRGLDITCGSCGEDYGTNVPDMDEIECPECEARRCPHCLTWYGGRS